MARYAPWEKGLDRLFQHLLSRRRAVFLVSGGYLALALGWLAVTHGIPDLLMGQAEVLPHLELYLEGGLILVTTLLVGLLAHHALSLLHRKEREMQEMARSLCAEQGDDFFQALVLGLSKTLQVGYGSICEFSDPGKTKVRTVAISHGGKVLENFEYDLAGSPCEDVVRDGRCIVPQGVRVRYPEDDLLRDMELESYLGVSLRGSEGKILGLMAVFDTRPMPNPGLAETILHLFAARASAELERRQTRETIDYLASYDQLTGLPNRQMFGEILARETAEADRSGEIVAVLFLDLDRFKNVNESLGHAMGDRVLKEVAGRLSSALRRSDTVARLGGDEFLLLLPGLKAAENAAMVAGKALSALQAPVMLGEVEVHVASSIGIALYPQDGSDGATLMKNADTALHQAKVSGRNNFCFFTPEMNALSLHRFGMENELRKALERQEFILHYQPQYEVGSGRMIAAEALIRWIHPERGLVPPLDFIPIAEETGLIVPIGQWVLRTACLQNKAWQEQGLPRIRVATNLSARQFYQQDLAEEIGRVLEETGLEPTWLELEITESIIIQDVQGTIRQLSRLRDLGIQISIDDFGIGYSSLNYLKQFPINSLKIDRSFVNDIGKSQGDTAIVSTVISLAHNLDLDVVAEGVETRDQLDFLSSSRCNKIQGFLFSRPVPSGDLPALLTGSAPPP